MLQFSLASGCGVILTELLGSPTCRLSATGLTGSMSAPGEVVLCENVRFNAGEKADDETLSRNAWPHLCDVFVMDAFGTAHRAQASTHGVAKFRAGRLCGSAAGRKS